MIDTSSVTINSAYIKQPNRKFKQTHNLQTRLPQISYKDWNMCYKRHTYITALYTHTNALWNLVLCSNLKFDVIKIKCFTIPDETGAVFNNHGHSDSPRTHRRCLPE